MTQTSVSRRFEKNSELLWLRTDEGKATGATILIEYIYIYILVGQIHLAICTNHTHRRDALLHTQWVITTGFC